MKFYKFAAHGDQVFVRGGDENAAREVFSENIGFVPAAELTVTEIEESSLPEGEVWLDNDD